MKNCILRRMLAYGEYERRGMLRLYLRLYPARMLAK